ncbi:MAG: hypothetical protein KVP17_004707 [Porospora cf. gigantea B]|uniref:uncharacterized protein n=1 Tax=Porospora cf. gigantea B TaxID=2853592 RepID=UPI00357189B1|nr:MAG: hypothetical protein KVP17_004707 [Porospora cf. gigantea B]
MSRELLSPDLLGFEFRPVTARQAPRSHTQRENVLPFLAAQATLRLAVKAPPAGYNVDPDTQVPWDQVRMVEVSEARACPVCLAAEMCAPHAVRCGHVFCWPCVVEWGYLS